MPGFAAYQESVNVLQDLFSKSEKEKRALNLPVLMVVAEKDSVVGTSKVAEQFRDNFTHPHKCLLWQGEDEPDVPENTLVMQTMNTRSSGLAQPHMSTLFQIRTRYMVLRVTFAYVITVKVVTLARCKAAKKCGMCRGDLSPITLMKS